MHISKFKQSNDTNSTFLPKLKYSERNENSEIEQNNNSEDKDQSLLINTLIFAILYTSKMRIKVWIV